MNVAIRNRRGFTLIEIMVVITIMAILTAIVYSSFSSARTQSRDNQKVSDMNVIQLALEEYFNQNHTYPLTLTDPTFTPKYIPSVPTPPTGGTYNYFPLTQVGTGSAICTSYQLWTTFEQTNSYLISKKGFNSQSLPVSIYECGTAGSHLTSINAGSTANPDNSLVYDVMPQ